MQINRLTEIVFLLLKDERMSAGKLADYFGVSTRTIYRDIDVLSVAGVPIYTEKGKGGGIYLDESYSLKKAMLNKTEQQELMSLLSMRIATGVEKSGLIDKLSGLFKHGEQSIRVDFSSFSNDDGEMQVIFDTLNTCVLEKFTATFGYYNKSGDETTRTVEPLKLIYKHRLWYLYAYCLMRNECRIFRLSRMSQVIKNQERFTRCFDYEKFIADMEYSGELTKVVLWLDKSQKVRVYDEFNRKTIKITEEGDYIVYMNVPPDDWVYGYILGFGENVKVLEPPWLNEKIIQLHKKAIEKLL